MERDFTQFEEKAGVTFQDKSLLQQAFTHRSYINEHKRSGAAHNERLEFLGDAVLELVITDFLYKKYPDKPEGELTSYRAALVNAQTCSDVAGELNLNDFLLLSKGESKDTGRARQYILADMLEAVIGAIYLDQGYDKARDFIAAHLSPRIDEIVEKGNWIDAKSRFQEMAQEHAGITPVYQVVEESGPDHDKRFVVGVFLADEQVALGEGNSKQEAEQKAAERGLEEKGWN
ncbi:MAG: ribonuclease III [Candidatus Paceibacterota bacterium]